MFTKEEIKARVEEMKAKGHIVGLETGESLHLASIIANAALFDKIQRSGEDYMQHPMEVAAQDKSKNKRIIAILHDVVEDSDWTLEDLKEVGFSERILKGVDGVTQRPNEPYFDFIERCSISGEDAIAVKLADLDHNSDPLRYRHIVDTPRQILKAKAYNVAYHYLVDLLKVRADPQADYNEPGRSIVEYIKTREGYKERPEMANELLDAFSSRPERLEVPDGMRFALLEAAMPHAPIPK